MNSKQQSFLSILLLISAFTLARAEVTNNADHFEFSETSIDAILLQVKPD